MEDKREDIILSIRGMSKSFGRNRVLDHINLDVKRGTVMGLMGENGAGKSTLIKILGGVYTKDSGQILVDGQEVEITGVESAKEHGIRIIHQELMLIPDMTISENIFIFCAISCNFGGFSVESKRNRQRSTGKGPVRTPCKKCGAGVCTAARLGV